MAYSETQKKTIFDSIISEIESGKSLIQTLKEKGKPATETFYKWLEEDETKAKRYARACEIRELLLLDEIIEISDHREEDHTPFTGSNVVQRDRLRIDARKWALSKLNPKKYGDKTDITTDGEKITTPKTIKITYKRNEDNNP